jgi:hypothetical protein
LDYNEDDMDEDMICMSYEQEYVNGHDAAGMEILLWRAMYEKNQAK